MANKTLFQSQRGRWPQAATAVNEAGGLAYAFEPKHALAQYVVTGTLNGTFYANAETQLDMVLKLAAKLPAEFLAKLAVFARQEAYMKDTPALLLAVLTTKDSQLFQAVAPRVIDNAKMLRNFVQIMRSGVVGRKSLGTAPKRFVQQWLAGKSPEALFRANVGQDPSLADILKMVHPAPTDSTRDALYAYLIGKPFEPTALPPLVHQYEAFKTAMLHRADVLSQKSKTMAPPVEFPPVPDVPFQMLTALPLTGAQWKRIAETAGWQMTRMNLNTFARHGVFTDKKLTRRLAQRLADPAQIAKAKVFPYQLLTAYLSTGPDVPGIIREALQDAMEAATANVPAFERRVVVFVDVSGSMWSPVTGFRKGATSQATCVQVAALVASVILRQNRGARILPFHDKVVDLKLNPRDSVMTNAKRLSSCGSGGTNCSKPLAQLNREKARADLVIYVSDNESWIDSTGRSYRRHQATATLREWETFKQRNQRARLVCLDLQPYGTTQAPERDDILNIGGFADQVFTVIDAFAKGQLEDGHWIERIERSVPL